jgi:hypothetical protein
MCVRPIEAQAPIDFEWMQRPYAGFFQEADPAEGQSALIVYRGDSIRFLMPSREWVRMTFECAFDVGARKLVAVRLKQGRLGQMAPPLSATASAAPAQHLPKVAQQQPKQIDGAALGAAIQRAAQQPKARQKPAKTMIIAEPSSIEVEQMSVIPN